MSSTTAADIAVAKAHTSLTVSDLAKSVEFYRVLLGLEPAKQRRDYAKFELTEPPLILSLIHDWLALKNGPAASHFLLLPPANEAQGR